MTVNEPSKDPSPTNRLSPDVMGRLRESLRRWADADGGDESDLGPALRAVANDARERGVLPEELLVTLKHAWFDVAGAALSPHGSTAGKKRLDDLVTACIKAYYE